MQKTQDVEVYASGMIYCSVCADETLSGKDVAARVEATSPAGTEYGWEVAEEDFRTGEENPHPCEDAEGRRHWLLIC